MTGQSVDNRVVSMQFDNAQFENKVSQTLGSLGKLKESLKFTDSTKGLQDVERSVKNVSFDKLLSGVETISGRFTNLGIVGVTAIQNIVNRAVDAGTRIASALTVDPVKLGFQEYETQINAVQTILANTESKGSTLKDVNSALDELNKYADMTIYNFTEMTRNIGTFTAAGVDLDTSVSAIKGIANLAAVSGSTSLQASTAMYQLSQALAAGTVKLQDWNSVVNAGMGGQVFQDALKETAKVHGIKIDEMIKKEGSFRETLQEGWLSSEILTETLSKFTGDLSEEQLKSMGYTDEQVKKISKMGQTANDAATKVKTFTQLFDTLQEAAQSGWTQTWEILVGDFEEAKTLLTRISDEFSVLINQSAESRNALLGGSLSSGWSQFMEQGVNDAELFQKIVTKTAKDHGVNMKQMIGDNETFEDSLKKGWVTGDILSESVDKMAKKLGKMSQKELEAAGYTEEDVKALKDFNKSIKNGSVDVDDFANKIGRMSGRENIIEGLFNVFNALMSVIKPIKEAMTEIFPPIAAETVYQLTENFYNFTKKLEVGDETAEKIKNTFKGVFSILKLGVTTVKLIANAFGEVLKIIFPLSGNLLDFTSDLGLKITDFVNNLGDFSKLDAGPISDFMTGIQDAFGSAKEKLSKASEVISRIFSDLYSRLEARIEPISNIGKNLWEAMKNVVKGLMDSAPTFEEIAEAFDAIFQKIRDVFSNAFSDVDFDAGLDVLNTGMLAGLVLMIRKFIKDMKDAGDGGDGILSKLKDLLDGVKSSLEAWQQNLNAKTLFTLAAAVAILAGSLIALSMVDSEKLGTALLAITILFADLMASLSAFSTLSKDGGLTSLTQVAIGFIGLSVAVLILTAAVGNLAKLNWEDLAKGLIGVGVVIAELGLFLKAVSKMDKIKFNSKVGIGLIAMASAILILTVAIERLGSLNPETLAQGLLGMSISLLALTAAMDRLNGLWKGPSIGVGMIAMAAALVVLSVAVERFGNINPERLAIGLLGMSAALYSVTGAMKLLDGVKNSISASVGLIGIAAAMVILAQAVEVLGNMNPENMARGLFAMSVSLLAIIGAVTSMPDNISVIAGSLLLISTSMVVLAGAMGILGSMDGMTIAKSLIAMGGALLIIAGVVQALQSSIEGAATLAIIAGAIMLLTPALMLLGSMSIEQIGNALLALAGSLALMAAAGMFLAPFTAEITAVAIALAIFGAACLSVGAGIALLSLGLVTLSGAGTTVGLALTAIIASLAGSIPLIITKIGQGLVMFVKMIGDNASTIAGAITNIVGAILTSLTTLVPQVGALISAVISELLRVLTEAIPQVGELITTLVTTILNVLVECVPQMAAAGLEIITGILQGIASNIGGIVQAGADIIVNFLQGVQANIGRIIDEGIKTAIAFINGIADGMRNNKEEIWAALENLITAIVEFFAEGASRLLEIGGDILDGIGQGVSDAVSHLPDFLQSIVDGVVDFLNPAKLLDAGADFFGGIFGGGDQEGEANEKGEETGEAYGDGTAEGIKNSQGVVDSSAKSSIDGAQSAADGQTSGFNNVGLHIAEGTASGIRNNTGLVDSAASDMIKSAEAEAKKTGLIKSPSRLFINQVGKYIALGCAVGIERFSNRVTKATGNMIEGSVQEASKGLDLFSQLVNVASLDDMSPKITPVVDLTNVEKSAGRIDGLLSTNPLRETSIASKLAGSISMDQALSGGIAANFNGQFGNDDVVSAIKSLGQDIRENPGVSTTNVVNGVSYDDGTNIGLAVGGLAAALKIDGRS